MGNYSLRMCPCFADGEKGGFTHSSIEQHKEEKFNDSLNVTDVHVLSSPSEDGYNQVVVTPINICPRVDRDIPPPPSKPVVIYPEPQYVLPGSADYGMAPTTEEQGEIFPAKEGRLSPEMCGVSDTTGARPLEDLHSCCRSENVAESDFSDYVRAFPSPPDSPGSPTFKIEENPFHKGVDNNQRVSCNPPNKTYKNKSSDFFTETSQEKSADDNGPFSDGLSPSTKDNLFLNNKADLDFDSAHLVDACPRALSGSLNISPKIPESSDSRYTPSTSGCLRELSSRSKPRIKKRVSFSLEVTAISPPILPPASSCDMDDLSVTSSSTSVEQRSLSDVSETGSKETYDCRPQFHQPAADYIGFRNRLQTLYVSLENVWFSGNIILGTVKVHRLNNRSSVFLRCTYDAWNTHVDIPATNTPAIFPTQYMTYNFEINMPVAVKQTMRIVFAVCLKAGNKMYWDNNDGRNYEIVFNPRT